MCSRRTMSPINFGAAQLLEALKIFAPEKSEQLDDQLRAYLTGRLKRDDVIAVAQAVVGPEVMREALRKMVPGYDEMAKPAQEEAEKPLIEQPPPAPLTQSGCSRLLQYLSLCAAALKHAWTFACWLLWDPPPCPAAPGKPEEEATLLRPPAAAEAEARPSGTKLRKGFLVGSRGLGGPPESAPAPAPAPQPPVTPAAPGELKLAPEAMREMMGRQLRWLNMPSTLSEDSAPCARLAAHGAQAAPTHSRA